jgi:hypothetical protein
MFMQEWRVQILNLDRNSTMMEPPHWTRTWIATTFGRLLSALDLNYCNYNQNIPETMQHIAKSAFKITNGMGQEHKVANGKKVIWSYPDGIGDCTSVLLFCLLTDIFLAPSTGSTLMWNSWCHVPVLELALKSATLTKTRSEPQYHPYRLGQNQNSEIISVITDMFQKHIMLKLMGFWFCSNSQTIQTCQPRTSIKFFHLHLVYLFASLSVHILFYKSGLFLGYGRYSRPVGVLTLWPPASTITATAARAAAAPTPTGNFPAANTREHQANTSG